MEVGGVPVKKCFMVIIFSAFFLGLSVSCGYRSESLVDIGAPAPSFQLEDLNGQKISLEQFRGKIVLLDFWATWCEPCRMTMPVVERLSREYSNDMVLLAVNLMETPEAVERYVVEQGIQSRVLFDKNGEVGRIYGAESIPLQFLIDRDGVVRNVQAGFSPSMASKLRSQIEPLR